MREWKATLTSEKSFSGWIFNSAQPPKGTLGMSARRILDRAAQRFSTLAPPPNLHSLRQLRPTTRRRDFVPWRFSAAGPHSASVDRRHRRPEKLHKAQTQRFRAVSSASALYPEHPSVNRPSGPRRMRPVIEAAPNSGYSDYLPSCSVGGRRVR